MLGEGHIQARHTSIQTNGCHIELQNGFVQYTQVILTDRTGRLQTSESLPVPPPPWRRGTRDFCFWLLATVTSLNSSCQANQAATSLNRLVPSWGELLPQLGEWLTARIPSLHRESSSTTTIKKLFQPSYHMQLP